MMLGKLSEKILKYHKIFNIGVVASFSYLPIYFFELSSTLANKTSGTGFLFFILAIFLGAVTIWLGITSFYEVGQDILFDLPSLFGITLLKKHYKKLVKTLAPHQNTILTTEEKKENEIAQKFIATMLYLNKSYKKAHIHFKVVANAHFNIDYYTEYSSIIEPLYEQHFKSLGIMAKSLIFALDDDRTAKQQFPQLWKLHNQTFTQSEIEYIEKMILKFKVFNFELLTYFLKSDEVIYLFSQLSFATQSKLLSSMKVGDLDENLYNQLVVIHKGKDEYQEKTHTSQIQEHLIKEEQKVMLQNQNLQKEVGINLQTQKTLDSFEVQFNALFERKDVLDSIKELMFTKERMSYLLNHFDFKQEHIEDKLFLDNDVDRVIKSFSEEVLILTKMKFNQHPKLEERKAGILQSMLDRIIIIKQKMLDINQKLNESMDSELELEVSINQSVLKAKI